MLALKKMCSFTTGCVLTIECVLLRQNVFSQAEEAVAAMLATDPKLRYLNLEKSPNDTEKSPIGKEKSPNDTEKSPNDTEKSPIGKEKSPIGKEKSPIDK